MGNLGVPELLIILLLLLIFFGAKKIPEMAQGLGKGIREFRKATREGQAEAEADADERVQQSKRIDAAAQSGGETAVHEVCYFCHAGIAPGAKFCPSCGKSLVLPRCSKCNTENALGSKFCKECGTTLQG